MTRASADETGWGEIGFTWTRPSLRNWKGNRKEVAGTRGSSVTMAPLKGPKFDAPSGFRLSG